jgi:UDP-N-acetyl-D-galactosamine dehydrogenase
MIMKKDGKIAIIGLGYVGLPLAVEFGKSRDVVGFDINNERIEELLEGRDRTLEVTSDELTKAKHLIYTSNENDLDDCDIFIVTVPTPIDERNQPDLTPVRSSTEMVGRHLTHHNIIIYESTVYPGVTEDICAPILEKTSGLKLNQDFFLGYSPERIVPGDKERTLTKILKITSGSTPEAAEYTDQLYKSIITAGTFKASSIKVAEAAKVIENTQRDVNIALINELAQIFDTMGISTREVIEAAGTKWNFTKLYPGLVGGHCIGVDPYYLTWKALENGYTPNLILAARLINNSMSKLVAEKLIKTLIQKGKLVRSAKILILGVTFKEDCPDMRNTKVSDVIEEIKEFGCEVDVWDPWVDPNEEKKSYHHGIISDPFKNTKLYDGIVVAVAHRQFKTLKLEDYLRISQGEPVIIDVKGIAPQADWTL